MGKLDLGKVQEIQDKRDNQGRGENKYTFDKLKAGKNLRRILFPKGNESTFVKTGYVHFNVGPDKKMVVCPKSLGFNKPCPVCEYVDELKETDQKAAGLMRRTKRNYVNVIDRDGEEEEPKILHIPQSVLYSLTDIILDADYGDITDYNEGRDVTINRKGEGIQTEYNCMPKINRTQASEKYTEEQLDDMMCDLNTLVTPKSYEEILAIMSGVYSNNNDYEDDEQKVIQSDNADDEVQSELLSALANKNSRRVDLDDLDDEDDGDVPF